MDRPPLLRLFILGVFAITMGIYAYFLALSLNPPVPALSHTRWVEVAVDNLNFREEPSEESEIIRKLDFGEKVELLAEQGNWFKVQDAQGYTGWVSRLYVLYSPPGLQ